MSPVPGFGPDSRESGPNRTRWTTKEVRWVVNERAMIVIAKTTIARKIVQLVRWSSRKARVVQACQSARARWVRHRSRLTRWDFAPPKPRPQTVTRSRVSRRTHLTSLIPNLIGIVNASQNDERFKMWECFAVHLYPRKCICKLLIFINSKNLRTIRKLIA